MLLYVGSIFFVIVAAIYAINGDTVGWQTCMIIWAILFTGYKLEGAIDDD